MDWQGIAAFVGALGVIITAIVLPIINSRLKQKELEQEKRFKKIEDEDKRKFEVERNRLSNTYSKLYGYMWELMFEINADRVFVIQPHPLSDRQYISVSLEVLHQKRDVSAQKDNFQFQKMSDWAGFIARISNEDWMIYKDLDEIKDNKVYLEAYRRGVKTLVFRRMLDEQGIWEGILCVEYTHSRPDNLDYVKGKIAKKSILVADILPEYKPVKKEL